MAASHHPKIGTLTLQMKVKEFVDRGPSTCGSNRVRRRGEMRQGQGAPAGAGAASVSVPDCPIMGSQPTAGGELRDKVKESRETRRGGAHL